mgnify:CR=1 FL=1
MTALAEATALTTGAALSSGAELTVTVTVSAPALRPATVKLNVILSMLTLSLVSRLDATKRMAALGLAA